MFYVKLCFLLLNTKLYQLSKNLILPSLILKAFRQYLPETAAYANLEAWKPVLCSCVIFLYVFSLVLLEFMFLQRCLVFLIGFMEKLFLFEIRNSRFVLKSTMLIFYSSCLRNSFFFIGSQLNLVFRCQPTDNLVFFVLKIEVEKIFFSRSENALAAPRNLYLQTSIFESFISKVYAIRKHL